MAKLSDLDILLKNNILRLTRQNQLGYKAEPAGLQGGAGQATRQSRLGYKEEPAGLQGRAGRATRKSSEDPRRHMGWRGQILRPQYIYIY